MFAKFFEHMVQFRGGNSNYAFLIKHTDELEKKFRETYNHRVYANRVQSMGEWLMIHMSKEGCFASAQTWASNFDVMPEYMLIDFGNMYHTVGVNNYKKEYKNMLERIGTTLFRHPIVRKTFMNSSFKQGMKDGFVINANKKGLTQQEIFFSLYAIRSVYELAPYRKEGYPYLRKNGFNHVEACHLSAFVMRNGQKLSYGHTPYYFPAVNVGMLIDFIHGSKKFTGHITNTKPFSCSPDAWAALFGVSGLKYQSEDKIPTTYSGEGWERKEIVKIDELLKRFQDFKKEKASA